MFILVAIYKNGYRPSDEKTTPAPKSLVLAATLPGIFCVSVHAVQRHETVQHSSVEKHRNLVMVFIHHHIML